MFFLLYEVYETVAEREKHKESIHYRQWRDSVSDWMGKPRASSFYEVIAPR